MHCVRVVPIYYILNKQHGMKNVKIMSGANRTITVCISLPNMALPRPTNMHSLPRSRVQLNWVINNRR
jgi:hypothetical protein